MTRTGPCSRSLTAGTDGRHFLSKAAALLSSSLAFDDVLRHTIAAALPALGDFGFFDVVDGDGVRRTVRAHEAPDIDALLAPTQWLRQERTGVNLGAHSTGEPALHTDVDDAWYRSVAVSPEHLALLRELAFRSMVTVPVRFHSETLGALTPETLLALVRDGTAAAAGVQPSEPSALPIVST